MTGILRGRPTAWLVGIVACALALVAVDAGPGTEGRTASAEPVRNEKHFLQEVVDKLVPAQPEAEAEKRTDTRTDTDELVSAQPSTKSVH